MSNKGKNKKKLNLRSSLLVLLLIAILLIASTYAWFTANTVVTISTLNVHVEAKGGLQISADGINWKTVLSNEDIAPDTLTTYAGNVNQIPTTLEPVSTTGNVTDGKMDMFYGVVTAADAADDAAGIKLGDFTLTTSKQVDTKGTTGKYIVFDAFLKVDKDQTLSLTKNSDVKANTAKSEDRGLKNAARVAFVPSTDVAADGAETTTIQSLVPNGKACIWEPNYDVHTAAAVSAASSIYGKTTTQTGATPLPYYGVKAETAKPVPLNSKDTASFAEVTPSIQTKAANDATNKVCDLKKGITKVRIYMWVDGQDVDCENNASGSDITYDVQFSIPG